MNKSVFITGASRGIGLATAKKFIAEGWNVVGFYNQKPGDIQTGCVKYDVIIAKIANEIKEKDSITIYINQ